MNEIYNQIDDLAKINDVYANRIKEYRTKIYEHIHETYAKAKAVIADCDKIIQEHLSLFVDSPLCKKWDCNDTHIRFFNGGIYFGVYGKNDKNGVVAHTWMMKDAKDGVEQNMYDKVPCLTTIPDLDLNNYKKLLEVAKCIDDYYEKTLKLYDVIAETITKINEHQRKSLAEFDKILDKDAEVYYHWEFVKIVNV